MDKPKNAEELRDLVLKYINENNYNAIADIDVSDIDTFNFGSRNIGIFEYKDVSKIDFSKWDMSNAKDISSMFYQAKFGGNRTIENWDVSNVEDFSSCFSSAIGMQNLDLSKWNVSSGYDFGGMFAHSDFSGKGLDKWDMSNAHSINEMFKGCKNIDKSLDLSNWNVKKVSSMSFIFNESNFTGKGVDKWDVSNVEYFLNMFCENKNIDKNLDFSQWKLEKAEYMNGIFLYSNILENKNIRKLCLWDKYMDNVFFKSSMFGDEKGWYWFKEKYKCDIYSNITAMNKKQKKSAKELIKSLKNYIIRDV